MHALQTWADLRKNAITPSTVLAAEAEQPQSGKRKVPGWGGQGRSGQVKLPCIVCRPGRFGVSSPSGCASPLLIWHLTLVGLAAFQSHEVPPGTTQINRPMFSSSVPNMPLLSSL